MQILYRKIISAAITATLHALLLGLFFPISFGESSSSSLLEFITNSAVYAMYVYPIIFTYGILTSILSDKMGSLVARKVESRTVEIMISGSCHLLFGIALLWFSLIGAILFFITDRILIGLKKQYTWSNAFISLLLPACTLLLFILITNASSST